MYNLSLTIKCKITTEGIGAQMRKCSVVGSFYKTAGEAVL